MYNPELQFFWSARHLMMIYICIKFTQIPETGFELHSGYNLIAKFTIFYYNLTYTVLKERVCSTQRNACLFIEKMTGKLNHAYNNVYIMFGVFIWKYINYEVHVLTFIPLDVC